MRNAASMRSEPGEPRQRVFGGGWRAALALGTLGVGLAACEGPLRVEPPGGGRRVELDYAVFVSAIEPILASRGCSNVACHGGQGSGMLLLSDGSNPQADFTSITNHTLPWAARQSPLLLKPLAMAAGGVVHGGGDVFADTTEADYRTILLWIEGTP